MTEKKEMHEDKRIRLSIIRIEDEMSALFKSVANGAPYACESLLARSPSITLHACDKAVFRADMVWSLAGVSACGMVAIEKAHLRTEAKNLLGRSIAIDASNGAASMARFANQKNALTLMDKIACKAGDTPLSIATLKILGLPEKRFVWAAQEVKRLSEMYKRYCRADLAAGLAERIEMASDLSDIEATVSVALIGARNLNGKDVQCAA